MAEKKVGNSAKVDINDVPGMEKEAERRWKGIGKEVKRQTRILQEADERGKIIRALELHQEAEARLKQAPSGSCAPTKNNEGSIENYIPTLPKIDEVKVLRLAYADILSLNKYDMFLILANTHKDYPHDRLHPETKTMIERRMDEIENERIKSFIKDIASKPNWVAWATLAVAIFGVLNPYISPYLGNKEHTPATDTVLHKPSESSDPVHLASQEFWSQLEPPTYKHVESEEQYLPDSQSKGTSASHSTSSSHTNLSSLSISYLDPQFYLRWCGLVDSLSVVEPPMALIETSHFPGPLTDIR